MIIIIIIVYHHRLSSYIIIIHDYNWGHGSDFHGSVFIGHSYDTSTHVASSSSSSSTSRIRAEHSIPSAEVGLVSGGTKGSLKRPLLVSDVERIQRGFLAKNPKLASKFSSLVASRWKFNEISIETQERAPGDPPLRLNTIFGAFDTSLVYAWGRLIGRSDLS